MINKDGGTIFLFYEGDTAVMRGDIELMGGLPTRENPARNDSFWKKCSCEPCL